MSFLILLFFLFVFVLNFEFCELLLFRATVGCMGLYHGIVCNCICRRLRCIFDRKIWGKWIFQSLRTVPHREDQLRSYFKRRTHLRSTMCVNSILLGLFVCSQLIFEIEKSCCRFVCWTYIFDRGPKISSVVTVLNTSTAAP